jgi:hypothetical protein
MKSNDNQPRIFQCIGVVIWLLVFELTDDLVVKARFLDWQMAETPL